MPRSVQEESERRTVLVRERGNKQQLLLEEVRCKGSFLPQLFRQMCS